MPAYDNEIPTDDQIVKNGILKIDSFIAENPQHIEAIRYRKYHDKEANGENITLLKIQMHLHADQIKRIEQTITPEPKKLAKSWWQVARSSVNIGYLSVFRIIFAQCILKYQFIYHRDCWHIVACLLWMWPEQTESLKWLIGSSITSVPLHGPHSSPYGIQKALKLIRAFSPPANKSANQIKVSSNKHFITKLYALSFAQLVLGCQTTDVQYCQWIRHPNTKNRWKEVPYLIETLEPCRLPYT